MFANLFHAHTIACNQLLEYSNCIPTLKWYKLVVAKGHDVVSLEW